MDIKDNSEQTAMDYAKEVPTSESMEMYRDLGECKQTQLSLINGRHRAASTIFDSFRSCHWPQYGQS